MRSAASRMTRSETSQPSTRSDCWMLRTMRAGTASVCRRTAVLSALSFVVPVTRDMK